MTTFGAWLLRQNGRRGPVGDLARDYAAECPCGTCTARTSRRYSINGVRAELDQHHADPAAYDALNQAATEWTHTR